MSVCTCTADLGRDDTDRLRALVAGGMGQWEASRLLWGGVRAPLEREAFAEWARASFMARFPWLRLPTVWPESGAGLAESGLGAMHAIERYRIATEGLKGAQIAITGDVA